MKKIILIVIGLLSFCELVAQDLDVKPAFEHLVNIPKVRDFTLNATGNEAYLTIQSPMEEISVIGRLKKIDGVWSEPEIVSFTGDYFDLEPFLSYDGLRLYFVSNRPLEDSVKKEKDFDIWYVERKNTTTEWSKAMNLGKTVNTAEDEFYPSLAKNNNLYFTRNSAFSDNKDDIYFCKWNKLTYEKATAMNDSINSGGYEFNAFIAPDESFLIYTGYNRKDTYGSGDLYITYQKTDKTWTSAKNMGKEINSPQMDYCPFYDVNQKTLYFTSKRSELVNKKTKDYNSLLQYLNSYSNGLSRIYKVQMDLPTR
ncbi:MAG: hypothetical protein V4622_11935 [Bacteroidota bacterium]